MADESKISFILDLDSEKFITAGEGALHLIEGIGNPDMSGLLSMLGKATEALGVVGLAVEVFKVGLDLTLEGENIERIENQFKSLSTQAGISGEELKESMVKASGGLVSTNELLMSANKAIIELGPNSKKLPEVLELSRKAVAVFGGDVKTTFDEMTFALANGNQRWLKHHGIVLDTTKAMQDFANKNNIAVSEISAAGRQQALFAAGLEAAKDKFKNISTEMGQTTTALTSFKVAWKEIVELVTVIISDVLGPKLKSFFNQVTAFAGDARKHLLAAFGKGDEADTAKIDILYQRLNGLKDQLQDIELFHKQGLFDKLLGRDPQAQAEALRVQIRLITNEIGNLKKKKEEVHADDNKQTAEALANIEKRARAEAANSEKSKANTSAFNAQKLKLEQETLKNEEKNVQSQDQIDAIMKNRQLEREKQHLAEIEKIEINKDLNNTRRKILKDQENKRFEQQELAEARMAAKEREKLDQDYLTNSKNVFQGIGRAAETESNKARADQKDFGKQGKEIYDGLKNTATSAFSAIGTSIVQNQNVASAAADAMKKAFLGFLGDYAIHRGEVMLGEGIFPPNPIAIAGGGALIALGSAIKSLAGSAGGGGVSGGGGGAGSSSGSITPTTETSSPTTTTQQLQQQQQQQRTVSINIAGNYLNSQESQRTLMEIMRNETDATGFQYNRIGVR